MDSYVYLFAGVWIFWGDQDVGGPLGERNFPDYEPAWSPKGTMSVPEVPWLKYSSPFSWGRGRLGPI